ncbi:sensor histidine kinase [Actinoallomurus vinaceus]
MSRADAGHPSSGAGAEHAERVLMRAFVLFRLGGLLQIGVAVVTAGTRQPHSLAVVSLAAVITAESLGLVALAVRRHRVPPATLIALDVCLCVAGLFVGAVLARRQDAHSWGYFMYPYSLLAGVGIGLGMRPGLSLACGTGVLMGGYIGSALTELGDPVWNVIPNSLTYVCNIAIAAIVAHTLRRDGRNLDRLSMRLAHEESRRAREQERARQARLLHDRILQTLETLVRDDRKLDGVLRDRLVAETGWLRAFVRDGEAEPCDDLEEALRLLAEEKTLAGLRVELHSEQLRTAARGLPPPSVATVEAIVGAAREALTNVQKHAAVDRAVVRAELTDGEYIVTVLDHGRGFIADASAAGTGVRESIKARMAEAGGSGTVESGPGDGTYVELRLHATAPSTGDGGTGRRVGPGQR